MSIQLTAAPAAPASSVAPGPAVRRVAALDGLRGLAALVVVVHHAVLSWQMLANQYLGPNTDSISWWLTFTPLHLAWAGTEAVMIFFVLSGMVLTLPFLDRPDGPRRWRAYYGRRLVRLYVPVLASLVLAALVVGAVPRVPGPTTSWWFNAHAVTVDAGTLATDAVLLGGVSWINPSLWSLQYEVLFSLLLPVYVFLARRLAARPMTLAAGMVVLVVLGAATGSPALSWLPMFGIGACLAVTRSRLTDLGARIVLGRHAGAIWWTLASLSVLLLLAEWWARGLGYQPTPLVLMIVRPLGLAGATLVCFLVMAWPAAAALCRWRPVAWLGTVSFSLYLVHEPILVSVASVVGGAKRGVAVTLVVGILLSLVVAALFHRFVEAPSQRLAGAIGRSLEGRRAPTARQVHTAASGHGARAGRPGESYPPAVPAPRCAEREPLPAG